MNLSYSHPSAAFEQIPGLTDRHTHCSNGTLFIALTSQDVIEERKDHVDDEKVRD